MKCSFQRAFGRLQESLLTICLLLVLPCLYNNCTGSQSQKDGAATGQDETVVVDTSAATETKIIPACQLYESGIGRVKCEGKCPSGNAPNCYVKFREEGSQADWDKSGASSMDKTPGMEYACYCDQ